MDNPKEITDFEELCQLLGEKFIIFCGSAISAFPLQNDGSHFLPMVYDVTEEVYNLLHCRLKNGDCYEQTLAMYAVHLVHGKHEILRKNMKFEEFIGQLEEINGREQVLSFLNSAFMCEGMQFGYNHVAIVNLLRSHRAIACLTTNFDNAIENADKNLYPLKPPIHTILDGKNLQASDLEKEPLIIKLHGDVVFGDFIATIPSLYRAEQLEKFRYLQNILVDKTILVIGYSGLGDIDIAPHLMELRTHSRAKLIWMIKNGIPPRMATHWFKSDLGVISSEGNKFGDQNCLMRLGGGENYAGVQKTAPDWRKRIKEWVYTLDDKKRIQVVQAAYTGRSGWVQLHIHLLNKWQRASGNVDEEKVNLLDSGIAYINVAAYSSAGKEFENIEPYIVSNKDMVDLILWRGFIFWRMGALNNAIKTLGKIREMKKEASVQQYTRGVRHYLEVSRDKLRFAVRFEERIKIFKTLNLDEYVNLLKSQKSLLDYDDPNEELLSDLILYDIDYLMKELIKAENIQKIFNRAYDLQHWGIAEAAARVLIQKDFWGGLIALYKVDKILILQKNYNTVRKSLATLFEQIYPFRWLRPIYYLDGPPFTSRKNEWVEWRLRRKMQKWKYSLENYRVICE